jgi:predicted acetyltransferase
MKICLANIEYLPSYQNYLVECFTHGLQKYQAASIDANNYLKNIIAHEKGLKLPDNMPRTSSYFCLNHDNDVVGTIRYRRGNSPWINRVVGHVGYETKPSSRGKGVANFMLRWLQENELTEPAIVTCELGNTASQKVIERCGGVFINQIYSAEKSAQILRFKLLPKMNQQPLITAVNIPKKTLKISVIK